MAITNTVASVTTIVRGLIKDQQKLDGRNVFEYKTDNKFTISKSFPDSTSIRVFKNNIEVDEQDWEYNSDTNQVIIDFITSGDSLVVDDIILILYSYYKKYSDTELSGYIHSSLVYFPKHKYNKTFEIDSDDNIYAVDNIDPTTDELFIIALVASILIDPQNIDIDVSGSFKITANRNKSDQAQISEVFAQYKRFVGIVTFESILDDLCGC